MYILNVAMGLQRTRYQQIKDFFINNFYWSRSLDHNIINTALLASSFLALFGIAEILYHFLKMQAELTRKIVHIGTGLLTLLFPLMLSNHWYVLFLCTSFAAILLASLRLNLLPSINAIGRKSAGSLCSS